MAPFFRKKIEKLTYLIEKCNHGTQKVRTDQMPIASTTKHVQTRIYGTVI